MNSEKEKSKQRTYKNENAYDGGRGEGFLKLLHSHIKAQSSKKDTNYGRQ
jgi:hypothetical protein